MVYFYKTLTHLFKKYISMRNHYLKSIKSILLSIISKIMQNLKTLWREAVLDKNFLATNIATSFHILGYYTLIKQFY